MIFHQVTIGILRKRIMFWLVLVISAITATMGQTCTNWLHNTVRDAKMEEHKYREITGMGRKECGETCVASGSCLSVNFNRHNLICQVNRKEDLVYTSGWEYIDKMSLLQAIDDKCAASPCPTLSTCVVLRSGIPICVKSECADASVVAFTEPITSHLFGVGKSVRYKCATKYTFGHGTGKLTCLANGQFENIDFECVPYC